MNTSDNEKVEKLLLHLAELVFEKNNRETASVQDGGRNLSKEQIEAREDFLIKRIAELKGITQSFDVPHANDFLTENKTIKDICLIKANKETLHSMHRLFGNTGMGIEIAVESYLFFKEMCSWETRGLFTRNELELFWDYYTTETQSISVEHFSFTGSRQGLVNVVNYIALKKPILFLLYRVNKEKLRNKILKISNAHLHLIIEEMILSIHTVNNRNKDKFLQIYSGTK